jgi:hypothetical protein
VPVELPTEGTDKLNKPSALEGVVLELFGVGSGSPGIGGPLVVKSSVSVMPSITPEYIPTGLILLVNTGPPSTAYI